MPLDDGIGENISGGESTNTALSDEIEALNSIYGPETLVLQHPSTSSLCRDTTAILSLPNSAISFLISFPRGYPDTPPSILGTASTGASSRPGEGEVAAGILRNVLGSVYSPGEVVLFDLVEEASGLLPQADHEDHEDPERSAIHERNQEEDRGNPNRSAISHATLDLSHDHGEIVSLSNVSAHPATPSSEDHSPTPKWTLSTSLTVNKSTFIARACSIHTLQEAQSAIVHLLSTNKKVRDATHNISAWRIKSSPLPSTVTDNAEARAESGKEIIIQDCDDDGESAAGGRLLHLLQLMEAWNLVVVVSRWYGGVKLGPDRFRVINSVAREVVVAGGWGKGEGEKGRKGRKGKKR